MLEVGLEGVRGSTGRGACTGVVGDGGGSMVRGLEFPVAMGACMGAGGAWKREE